MVMKIEGSLRLSGNDLLNALSIKSNATERLEAKEWIYRLEFKESTQQFHMELLSKQNPAEPNTHGWATIGEGKDYVMTLFISHEEHCSEPPLTVECLKRNWEYHLQRLEKCFK